MKRLGKSYESHIYPKLTHSFVYFHDLSLNRDAVADAWPRVVAFYDKYLKSECGRLFNGPEERLSVASKKHVAINDIYTPQRFARTEPSDLGRVVRSGKFDNYDN